MVTVLGVVEVPYSYNFILKGQNLVHCDKLRFFSESGLNGKQSCLLLQ